uniref:Uncharacterized protein n=1 Tax=Eutreptiella gymnastica TaxID=73025 RepID=A0A7S4CQ73_9EUGL
MASSGNARSLESLDKMLSVPADNMRVHARDVLHGNAQWPHPRSMTLAARNTPARAMPLPSGELWQNTRDMANALLLSLDFVLLLLSFRLSPAAAQGRGHCTGQVQ